MLDLAARRGLQQIARLGGVVEIIAERIGDRLRHHDLRGEMDDRLDVVSRDGFGHEVLVAEVADDQRDALGHGPAKAGREIVEDDRLFAGVEQFQHHVGADITGAARHQDRHRQHPFTRFRHPKLKGGSLNLRQPSAAPDAGGSSIKQRTLHEQAHSQGCFTRRRSGHALSARHQGRAEGNADRGRSSGPAACASTRRARRASSISSS